MGGLPPDVLLILSVFAPLFTEAVWQRVQVLLVGAILTPGRRTVASVLRVMGLHEERRFKNYHRVLSRARWSGLATSRVLLELLIRTFVRQEPLVMGLDDTIERRWGCKIAARVWALPFLTPLCPSERYYRGYHRAHRPLTERARQVLRLVQRWLPTPWLVTIGPRHIRSMEILTRDGIGWRTR